jgi:septal ring factor EnvC (AmiA/AmiB activator)
MNQTMNLKSALSEITGRLSALKTELEETRREMGSIDGSIHELRAMPVSLKDYGLFLRANIEKLADAHIGMLEFELVRDAPSLDASPKNKLPLSAVEKSSVLPPGMFGAGATLSAQAACCFFGDQIYDAFMRRAEAQFGKRWGNEDLPTVEDRRKTIAELEARREALKQKRVDLEAQIDEISAALRA